MDISNLSVPELLKVREEECGQLYENIMEDINDANMITYAEIVGILEIIKGETISAFYEQSNKRG